MKRFYSIILIFFFSLISFQAAAQARFQGLNKDYTQVMDSLLTYVRKDSITTGILYDRVFTVIDLSNTKDTVHSNYAHFIQGWHELYKASYTPMFNNVETLKNNLKAAPSSNIINIGVINTKINYIDHGTDSIPNLKFVEGYLQNIEGVNPIREKQVTVIAPLRERVNSGTVTFRLNNSFILQQTGVRIKNLDADFGDGILRHLITNQTVSNADVTVNYTTSGRKPLLFKVTFLDNSTGIFFGHFDLYIPIVRNVTTTFDTEEDFIGDDGVNASTPGNIAFPGYNESSGIQGELEYRTYYSLVVNDGNQAPKITKPIIILDGFDPGDKRKIWPGSEGYDPDESSIYEELEYDPDNNDTT